jgi:hypothetical protein
MEHNSSQPLDLIDAIALSIADACQSWEYYHTQNEYARKDAEYFLDTLRERGYDIIEKELL